MKKFLTFGLILAAFTAVSGARTAPPAQATTAKPAAPAAQTSAASFTGKWDGTLVGQRPDGTESAPQNAQFNLTQAGKVLTGTAGPPDQQWKIDKGAVVAGKATFEVQQPNGPLLKFALTIVKGRLQGTMTGEKDGETRTAKIDAGKAAK
jgi:hypothetical protein